MSDTDPKSQMCDRFDVLVTTTPCPPLDPGMWRRAEGVLSGITNAVDLAIVGDSIAGSFPKPFALAAARRSSLHNLGVSGFRCQQTLWLLQLPEIAILRPKAAMILVGTNNLTAGDKVGAIAAGILAIVSRIITIWDPNNVFLLQTVPRAPGHDFRRDDRLELHRMMFEAGKSYPSLRIIDADHVLNSSPEAYHADHLHINEFGYGLLANFIESKIGSY